MGCLTSAEVKEERRRHREEGKRNEDIELQILKDKMAMNLAAMKNEVTMLLLESGKTTLLDQMISRERTSQGHSIRNILFVQSMTAVLEVMESMGISVSPENQSFKDIILELPARIEADHWTPEVAESLQKLYADPGVQACIGRSGEYQLNDSATYYFQAIDRISGPDYLPTYQDVLRSRGKTTGIVETTFHIDEWAYRMVDVVLQRSETKKWIHHFENVTAIVFMVDISEYDQVSVEDDPVNRMEEALKLFDSFCNSRWLQKTSMILFLNKIDLFKEKLPKSPMGKYFPDYTGGDNYDLACEYWSSKFAALNQSKTKEVYTHFTCATDTTQLKFLLAAANEIIISNGLRDAKLL